ncbi:YhgE/Pip domain-containing protein [Streptomyces tubbatahanensis]|uniref:YhgE/Pip domain-containing protein n=1 Tax=Streptomyces tubbatahanensis TaxID=2923272 RepID=A0ABY3XQQ4_9ACTN|nr:YhgE/Pip domain-containing protein [Streptomyces tubbatahanensis]UNS96563.1 YhgE/Pip domain-containing protein [Streptomyces tubbatahanensis]
MRSPRLAALELKRFGRGRLPRAAMAAMLLLPLLYGALYLWSFWDPYDRLDKIPVALVNEDQGATAGGKKITAGDDIVRGLHGSDSFDWRQTSAKDAREGVEDGRYYLSLTVPKDFSERVSSSSGDSPVTGALKVRTNDANNYIVGQLSRTVFSEVRASASSKVSRGFYDNIYLSFSTLHGKTADAAKGADDLGDGIGEAKEGAGRLKGGLGEAEGGSGSLKDGTATLHEGAGTLASGAGQVAEGTQKLADKVNGAAGAVRPYLDEHSGDIGKAARGVARTSETLKKNLGKLPDAARRAKTDSREAADALSTLYENRCGKDTGGAGATGAPTPKGPSADPSTAPSAGPTAPSAGPSDGASPGPSEGARSGTPKDPAAESCPQLRKAADAAERSATIAAKVDGYVKNEKHLDELGGHLDDLGTAATALADRAPHLTQDVDAAVRQINKLNRGAHAVSTGAHTLQTGLGTAKDGAATLDTGLGKLSDGAASLDGGLFKLADGSGKLAGGLHDGVKQIPDLGHKERDARTGVMADPVGLASDAAHAAPNYGTGFAPYFIPLSLWVGAMVAYMLLQPLNKRALAAGAPGWRIALAGWLPVAAIGVAQVAALMSVLHWALGLQMARGAATVGFLLLVTACFTALVQFLNARFGPAGRILVLAMLMLQLTSAGGTYPIQTSPGFFNALHPFLPMSYVVDGLRHLITGGQLWPVWRACLVLLAFAVGALALTALTARRKQVWTLERLRPEISL